MKNEAKCHLKFKRIPLFCIRTLPFGLSLVFSIRVIPDHIPTIVSKHIWIPLSLITFLHYCNVLVESFPMLITYIPTVQWKEI